MQFTKLKLQGFKSFVDPVELMISTGLTGVVGPNGCGKSNLLEAMRWVHDSFDPDDACNPGKVIPAPRACTESNPKHRGYQDVEF